MTKSLMNKMPRRRGSFYYYQGLKYVSVTNVLQALAKPALIRWAAKKASGLVLKDPEQYDTIEKAVNGIYAHRDKAGDRGTEAHFIAERFSKGDVDISEYMGTEIIGYAESAKSFFNIMRPETIYSEVNVYSRKHNYAGTADLIANIGGETWLVDYKTSKGVYPEMGLQLEAYKNAEFALIDGEEVPLPEIQKTAVVLLKDDGSFVFHPISGDFEVFLALKKVWEWNHNE